MPRTRKIIKAAKHEIVGDALTPAEAEDRTNYEAVIREGMDSFQAVGAALKAIRDAKLYRSTHKTFESYCKDVWNWGKSYAYRVIGAAEVAVEMSTKVDKLNVAQASELRKVEPERRARVFEEAAAKSEDGEPTAAQIRKSAEPEHASELSMAQAVFDGADTQLRMFTTSIRDLYESERGRGLVAQAVEEHITALRGMLRMARPVGPCHRCSGAGCEPCFGSGWITLAEFRALSPEEQARVAREGNKE